MYLSLDPAKIVETCRLMESQIAQRFPSSGLRRVAGEILTVTQEAAQLSDWLAKPRWPLRVAAGVAILAMIGVLVGALISVRATPAFTSVAELLQGAEAAINEIVFLGIAGVFLFTMENRLKRRRALKAIHVLRSLAHIIDLHQIPKDPSRASAPVSAPEDGEMRPLTSSELILYLDHCTDLLSIISKVAALYVQRFDDSVTLAAVNEVESLTNGLARKIWQKIMILDRTLAPAS